MPESDPPGGPPGPRPPGAPVARTDRRREEPGPEPLDAARAPAAAIAEPPDPEASTVLLTAVTVRMPLGSGRAEPAPPPDPDGPPPATWVGRGLLAALVVVVAAAYHRSLVGLPLDWGDPAWLADPIQDQPTPQWLWLALSTAPDHRWAPVLRLSFAGLLRLGDDRALILHATSLALYLLTVVGLARLIRRLGAPERVALATVALWALHPSHVESVAWLSGLAQTESLASWVAAAVLAVEGRGDASRLRIAAVTALAVAALLTDVTTAPLPILLGGFLAWQRGPREAARRIGPATGAALALAAVGAWLWEVPSGQPTIPWPAWLVAAWVQAVWWAKALLVTAPAVFTPVPADPRVAVSLGLAATGALAVAGLIWRARAGPIAFAWLVPQLPFLGLAPMVDWATDRQLLVPSLALAYAVALLLGAVSALRPPWPGPDRSAGGGYPPGTPRDPTRERRWADARLAVALLPLLAALAWGTLRRVPDWHDSRTLWEVEVQRPGQHFARWYHAGIARSASHDESAAIEAFDRSLALWPHPDAVARRLRSSLALDGWTPQEKDLGRMLEPTPADGRAWDEALRALREADRSDLADWALGPLHDAGVNR